MNQVTWNLPQHYAVVLNIRNGVGVICACAPARTTFL